MHKFRLLIISALAITFGLSSCKKDDDTTACTTPATPTITASGPLTFGLGSSVTLTSSAANKNLWSTGDTTKSITVRTSGSYTVSAISGICTSNASAATVVSVSGPVAPREFTTILLAAPSADKASKSFFAPDTMTQTYSFNDASTAAIQSKLIFGYYFGDTSAAVISSIDDFPTTITDLTSWGANRNNTTFKSTTMSYDALTSNSKIDSAFNTGTAISAVGSGTAGKRVGGLTVSNNTYVFQVNGKKGAFKVTNLVTGIGIDGKITLAVKYQR